MDDENVLKSDLDQVSKEEMKERLVVAEMVMKKLFQRNKDLEEANDKGSEKKEKLCKECVELRE